MANLNWMGLGFSFGARDNGLKSAQDEAVRGFQKMDGAIGSVMAVAQQFTTQGMNLTTALEAVRQQNAVTAKGLIGSAGLTEAATKKARKEAASLAEATGMGIQTTSEAAIAHARLVQQLGSEDAVIQQLGLTTEALSKFQTGSGIKAGDFATALNTVAMNMKAVGKDSKEVIAGVKQVAETWLYAADHAGGFTDGLSGLNDMQVLINDAAATGEKDFVGFTKGISAAQVALATLVPDAKMTMSAVMGMAKNLQGARDQLQELYSGVGDDISPFQKEFAILFQDVNKSTEQLSKGPDELMKAVTTAYLNADSELQKSEMLRFFSGRMRSVLGSEQTDAIINFAKTADQAVGNVDDKLAAMNKSFGLSAMSLGKAVDKVYAGTRTAEDVAKKAEQQFVARFRALTGSSWDFTKNFQKATKEAGDILTAWSKESGPLGEFTKRMSRASKEGVAALFPPDLAEKAQVASEIVTQFAGSLDNIKGLGQSVLNLVSPFNLLSLAAGAVATLFGTNLLSAVDRIKKEFRMTGTQFNAVTQKMESDGSYMAEAVATAMAETADGVYKFVDDLGPKVIAGLDGLITSIDTFGKSPKLDQAVGTIGKVVDKLGELFSKLWHVIWIEHDLKGKTEAFWKQTVKPWLENTVEPMMQDVGKFLADILVKALANINWKEVGSMLWKGIKGLYNGIDIAMDNTLGSKLGSSATMATVGVLGGAALSSVAGPLAPLVAPPLMYAGAKGGAALGLGMSMVATSATDWLADNAAQGWMWSDHAARGRTTEDQQSLARKAGVTASIKASDKPMVTALQAVASGQVAAIDANTQASMGTTKSSDELNQTMKLLQDSVGRIIPYLNLPPTAARGTASLPNRVGMLPSRG